MARKYILVAEVRREGNRLNMYEVSSGKRVKDKAPYITRRDAEANNQYIGKTQGKSGIFWKRLDDIPKNYLKPTAKDVGLNKVLENLKKSGNPTPGSEIRSAISNSLSIKPKDLIIPDLQWKLAVRGALRGENILFLGASGSGKTLTARSLATALNRPFFKINAGAMQDARASLIGNTHYDPDKGTFFVKSYFIEAITTPNAVVYLDEMSRISQDAENILMTVLDRDQRYVRLDEDPNTPTINVASGVVFVATMNVGAEYTATRRLDRATMDRWSTVVEVPLLSKEEEIALMRMKFPKLNRNYIEAYADIADYTRKNIKSDSPDISLIISTRVNHELCKLALDGFYYTETGEALIFNMYDNEGGVGTSERATMKIKFQDKSHLDNESPLISEKNVKKDIEDEEEKPKKNFFDIDKDQLN